MYSHHSQYLEGCSKYFCSVFSVKNPHVEPKGSGHGGAHLQSQDSGEKAGEL